jgi:hypothetical protein
VRKQTQLFHIIPLHCLWSWFATPLFLRTYVFTLIATSPSQSVTARELESWPLSSLLTIQVHSTKVSHVGRQYLEVPFCPRSLSLFSEGGDCERQWWLLVTQGMREASACLGTHTLRVVFILPAAMNSQLVLSSHTMNCNTHSKRP